MDETIGCIGGTCVVWEFQKNGVAKELCDKDNGLAITSVCWSRCDHQSLTSVIDKSLTL